MSVKKMEPDAIDAALKNLDGWRLENQKLHREFQFTDFNVAIEFMTLCAARAEELDHHPEWFNVYNKVRVDLNTHSVQGISELDFKLAQSMNEFAERLG